MRVAAIMLDGAEPSFVHELASAGELPMLERLLANGTSVPLESPIPYRAEYACTEFLTGRPAEANRYWSTVVFDGATYACSTVGSARRTPFYADPTTGSVVVFDIPHSVLDDGVPGAQVIGWGGHDARFQHPRTSLPAGLMAEIDARFGVDPTSAVEYRGSWHQEWYINALADALVASARRRVDVARWLLDRTPDWSLFLMGLTELHSAGHNFAQGVDPSHVLLGSHPTAALARQRFIEVYRAVDDTVSRVAAALPADTTLAVLSTKGMIPNRDDLASNTLLPELLHRLSFGRPMVHEPSFRAWQRRGCPPVSPDPRDRSGARIRLLAAEGRFPRLKRRYRTLAPPPVQQAVRQVRQRLAPGSLPSEPAFDAVLVLPDGTPPVLAGDMQSTATLYRRHWPSMRWFALPSFSHGHVRLNVEGRERDGVVAVHEYHRECDELEAALRETRDVRTGEPIVDEVIRLRVDDPLAVDGPAADLVVTWRLSAQAIEHPRSGVVGPFPLPRSGSHTENGFLLLEGPGIPAAKLSTRPAIDVPPTLLALLGWPQPPRLTGSPIPVVTPATA